MHTDPGVQAALSRAVPHLLPQAPWPHLEALAEATAASGKALVPRCASLEHYNDVGLQDTWPGQTCILLVFT